MRSLAIDLLRELTRNGAGAAPALARACGATRSELARCIARLEQAQLICHDAGLVRLRAAFDFLDAGAIAAGLGATAAGLEIEVCACCASTNSSLLTRNCDGAARPVLLVAEEQTAGRGRRGRRWLSALGAGVTLSLSRGMRCPPRQLAGLSLACGVAAVRALRSLGVAQVTLKWPNDLLAAGPNAGAKVGGILVESRSRGAGIAVVAGIGVNCRAASGLGARLRRQVAALEEFVPALPSRNAIAAAIARELLAALAAFETAGLAGFKSEWESLHAHAGQRLRVRLADGRLVAGIADGIADDGGLRLRTRSGVRAVHSGRVISARAA